MALRLPSKLPVRVTNTMVVDIALDPHPVVISYLAALEHKLPVVYETCRIIPEGFVIDLAQSATLGSRFCNDDLMSNDEVHKERDADSESVSSTLDDDKVLEEMGYKNSFKREFTNLATISFAFSIMGLCSSVATTFNSPLLIGGPSTVTWCWILGSCMSLTLGTSIAEIVSAFPTCGGMYTASAYLCPKKYRAIVGWIVGWLNLFGQIVGLSSSEFGLANMIWAAVVVGKDGNYTLTTGKTVGLTTALLVVHGLLNCLGTRYLARFTSSFVFINIGATVGKVVADSFIIITLLATTPRSEMHTASYVFGSEGLVNQTGGWNSGLAFLFGLLSVQWTMTGYDATAHISEEVKRAAYSAPVAIFIAVIGTGLIGWLLNIVLILCSGSLDNLPGVSGSAFLEIMVLRIGKTGALILWTPVCLTAFFVCQTGLQAGSRCIYAFARDHMLPFPFSHSSLDLARINSHTKTPIRAIWFVALGSVLPGLLAFASEEAVNAIFAMTAMAFDLSYIVPIILRRIFENHPEVEFKPGPFYMGPGWFGWAVNIACILWTLFVCVIFSMPNYLPVNSLTMNYASVCTFGVVILSLIWYFLGGKRHYHGPLSDLEPLSPKEYDADRKGEIERREFHGKTM
ncbi:amino acid permease-domain-containing protein [Cytidiella melzeri]|nr:amino acid permease-domain-containing protein [Cytidiella melzeri]